MSELDRWFYLCIIFSLSGSNLFPEWRWVIAAPLLGVALVIYGYQRGLKSRELK